MFQAKKVLWLLAMSAFLAGCGGGGGTGSSGVGNPAPSPGEPTPSPGNPDPLPRADQRFNGHMEMVANQIMYIRTNRIIYLPVDLMAFESDTGIVDIAPGSPVAHYPDLEEEARRAGCTIEIDGTCGVQPPAVAPATPIAAFGLRISTRLLPAAPGQQVGNQTAIGRIAFDLTEHSDSPGVDAGKVPEIMRFVIDNVEMVSDESGVLTDVRMIEGARIHVYGRAPDGAEVRDSIPAPAGTVRLLPLSQIPDHNGDTSSIVLFMDLETGFSQAGSKLTALHDLAGHFAMHVTISTVDKIVRPAAPQRDQYPPVPQKDLIGKPISVNDLPPVTGGGISGNAWIRMYPS